MAALGDSYGTVTIGASAGLIAASKAVRNNVLIQNAHASNILYVGLDSSVTTANGIKVAAGESIQVLAGAEIYGIASGAGTDVRYMVIG